MLNYNNFLLFSRITQRQRCGIHIDFTPNNNLNPDYLLRLITSYITLSVYLSLHRFATVSKRIRKQSPYDKLFLSKSPCVKK